MIKLIINAKLPDDNIVNILIVNDKIIDVSNKKKYCDLRNRVSDMEIIDAHNNYVIPSYIDNHEHIIGGGGEDGFISKIDEMSSIDILKNGVTTVVGVLGTDTLTRSVENLVSKAKAFNCDDLTAFCLTGGYQYPSPTITGSVGKDIVFINEIIGAKIAISDHRCYNPNKDDLIKLLSEIRVAALIAKKVGILNIHVGWGKGNMDVLFDILNETNIPINTIRPTHITNNEKVFEQAMELTRKNGYMDITIDENLEKTYHYLKRVYEMGDINYITMSTDANGSCPIWDKGKVLGMKKSDNSIIHGLVKYLICKQNYSVNDAIRFVTTNPSRALGLLRKGSIKLNNDADMIIMDNDYNIDTVISKGKIIVKEKKLIKRSYYSE